MMGWINSSSIPEVMFSWWVLVPVIMMTSFIAAIEVLFYLYFRFYMLPFANKRLAHGEYQHYGRHRHKYMLRIMHRLIRKSATTKTHPLLNCCLYYLQWYYYEPVDPKTALPPVVVDNLQHECPSDLTLDSTNDEAFDEYWELFQHGMNVIRRDDADKFLCWALFGKHKHELEDWEMHELNKGHEKGEDIFGFDTKDGSANVYFPKFLLSLDQCVSFHRPLMFYAAVELFKQVGYLAFQMMGMKLHVTKTGLRCWYINADTSRNNSDEDCDLFPVLLFQGIAPGGPIYYLPLIKAVLARDGRPVFLFECEAVQCTPRFNSFVSQEGTIAGVEEVVDKYIGGKKGLCVMGHSYGSCQLTWLIHSPLRNRIKQFIILEPVSLMLSESDVIVNIHKPYMRIFIDVVMEWFIRRKFEWYNSELWLDDLPRDCHVIVSLAGNDFIVNSDKLKEEVESYSTVDKSFASRTKLLYFKLGTHGDCLINPHTWRNLREAMLQQQLAYYKTKNNNVKSLVGNERNEKLLVCQ